MNKKTKKTSNHLLHYRQCSTFIPVKVNDNCKSFFSKYLHAYNSID